MSPARARLRGAAAGVVVDRLVGEPPGLVHPVAAYGATMGAAEGRLWADDRRRGTAHAAL